jgi:tetratricopeptide (TPR) repeat protein
MSWGGNGGFFGPSAHVRPTTGSAIMADPGPNATAAIAPPATLDDLRDIARDTYAKGRLADAAEAQSAVLAMVRTTGTPTADDFLFAGLIHHAARRIADSVEVLRDGLRLFPENASLHENLAVLLLAARDIAGSIAACQTALALGSDSANVHDCLCDAYQRAGRRDLAVAAGRMALESKDRRFGAAAPLVAIPAGLPPAFNPGHPEQNVIAYTLWGNQPRYHVPLLENARIRPHLFPEWTLRVYHDHTVDPAYLAQLAAQGVQLRPMRLPPGVPAHRGLLWRFEVIADPGVQRFLIRDADSLLTVKERVAVDAWLRSDFHFHTMRDWYTHTDLLLAGMWGGVGGILPPLATLLRAYTSWRVENDHVDQDLLTETVWPTIRRNVLIHDSIFQPCLGSVPFPPFGDLPAGHHIGQNAFLHFSKSG